MKLNEGYFKNLKRLSADQNPSWFKNWFDTSFYHRLYAQRDEKEAVHFIDNLLPTLQPHTGAKMLDLGCGQGRHAKHLASKGYNVTGLDLAGSSINRAQRFETDNLHFFQHDMRIAFGRNYFDYVFNFFTSFGYFDSDEEHKGVIRNMSQSLKTNGVVMMDYINVVHASKGVFDERQTNIDGVIYNISKWMNEKHFFKKISVDVQSGKPFTYIEKVAKLKFGDFEKMFVQNDLDVQEIYGDYDLGSFDINNSPRLIMVARKKSA